MCGVGLKIDAIYNNAFDISAAGKFSKPSK